MRSLLLVAALFLSVSLNGAQERQSKLTIVQFEEVIIQRSPSGSPTANELLLTGVFPNSCYKFLRAEVRHLPDNVHEVLGIGAIIDGKCMMVTVPFRVEVDLGVLDRGRHIVRVLNGDGTIVEKAFEI